MLKFIWYRTLSVWATYSPSVSLLPYAIGTSILSQFIVNYNVTNKSSCNLVLTLASVSQSSTRYSNTWLWRAGSVSWLTSPNAPSIRRQSTTATSGNQPRTEPPAITERLSRLPPSGTSRLVPSPPLRTSICIGESLIELLSTPLDAAGEGERVGPSDSKYWIGVPDRAPRNESIERDFLDSLLWNWLFMDLDSRLAKRRATSCSTDTGNTEIFINQLSITQNLL